MRTLIISTLAFSAMTSVALADAPGDSEATKVAPPVQATKVAPPVQLTKAQLDQVTAGFNGGGFFVPFQGQGGNGFGGACQFCRGPEGEGGDGISFDF